MGKLIVADSYVKSKPHAACFWDQVQPICAAFIVACLAARGLQHNNGRSNGKRHCLVNACRRCGGGGRLCAACHGGQRGVGPGAGGRLRGLLPVLVVADDAARQRLTRDLHSRNYPLPDMLPLTNAQVYR